jgi:hypothetical protein
MDFDSKFFNSCVAVAAQQESNGSPLPPFVVSSTATLVVSPTTTVISDLDLTKTKDVPEDILSYPGAFL